MTIDRRIMAEKVLGTGEKPAWHFTPDVTAGFTPEISPFEQMSQQELNAQAKTLLQAAGYGPQRPLKLTLLYNTSVKRRTKNAKASPRAMRENDTVPS